MTKTRYQLWLSYDQKCSICPFHKRTSEVKLPLLQRVEVRERVLDEIRRHAHHLGGWWWGYLFCSWYNSTVQDDSDACDICGVS